MRSVILTLASAWHVPVNECVRVRRTERMRVQCARQHRTIRIHCMDEIYTLNGFLHFHFKCHKLIIFYLHICIVVQWAFIPGTRPDSDSAEEKFAFVHEKMEMVQNPDAVVAPLSKSVRVSWLNYMETNRNERSESAEKEKERGTLPCQAITSTKPNELSIMFHEINTNKSLTRQH